MEDNFSDKRSGGGGNIFWAIILVAFLFALYKTNPTPKQFGTFLATEVAKKMGADQSTVKLIGGITDYDQVAEWINKFSNREDYVFFSIYTIEVGKKKNQFFGVFNNFIPFGGDDKKGRK
ncbi:MAG: DUF4359 domain-containing protein [Ferruginibacter sp.]|nr:DUF4359 domain-containing protein [Ferruginibacter sp.]